MKFKPQNYTDRDNILSEGYLTDLAQKVFSGEKLNTKTKLSDAQMAMVPSMYAQVDLKFDPRKINNEGTYYTHDKKPFKGSDLKAITALMYSKSRGFYHQPSRPYIHDSSFCAGTPLGLLGLKRFRNIKYNDYKLDVDCFVIHEGGLIEVKPEAIEKLWLLDQLLSQGLASTQFEAGDVVVKDTYGIGMLCALDVNKTITVGAIMRILREHGMGNRDGTFANRFGASVVPLNTIKEELTEDEKWFVQLYNRSSQMLKHMLLQRWVWYGMHRNSDMICNYKDWDNLPDSLDKASHAMLGLKPTKGPIGTSLEYYGI